MRWLTLGIVVLDSSATLEAADRTLVEKYPLVEKYLHSGEFAKGEQTLEAVLAAEPKNDQVRFGLGVLQFVRGVERLGQSLHEYGVKSEHTDLPFLRLPVPKNPDPAPISYTALRRVLDDFIRDLVAAEATLAGITDDKVKLPLRLASIHLDLAGTGKANHKFVDVLKKLMRQDFEFLKTNPDFLVCFDRGDVAWLRAYCHLLSAMLDIYLAFDTQAIFESFAREEWQSPRPQPPPFAKVKLSLDKDNPADKKKLDEFNRVLVVKEPARLARFRKHMLQVCALNRETWKFIRAETDDDHEWLPNSRQKGVLGLPVRDEMIDAWLGMIGEFESLLDGKKLAAAYLLWNGKGKGLNLRKLLDDPPEQFDINAIIKNGPAEKYLEDGKPVDIIVIFRAFQIFGNTFGVAYVAWFN